MNKRPILFSAPMVRAILSGTKTQTRRVCKPAQAAALSRVITVDEHTANEQRSPPYFAPGWFGDEEGDVQFRSPFGVAGDLLWVREAWKAHTCFDYLPPRDIPKTHLWYMADDGYKAESRFRQGMFMPRWASRITLEVTGVRVERLQDISEADAMAEGIARIPPPPPPHDWSGPNRFTLTGMGSGVCAGSVSWNAPTAVDLYRRLWESINGPGSWEANPWVWVVSFKVVQP